MAFNDEHLPGREAFPCVKLKPSATVTRALVARGTGACSAPTCNRASGRLRPRVGSIAASLSSEIGWWSLTLGPDRERALRRWRASSVNHHVVAFSHLSFPKRRDRGVCRAPLPERIGAHRRCDAEIADATLLRQAIHGSRAAFEVMPDFDVPAARRRCCGRLRQSKVMPS